MTVLHFLRRCWTGEDLTAATTVVGLSMLVVVVWSITAVTSAVAAAFGVGEPASTIVGFGGAGSYVVLGYRHDKAAMERRELDTMARVGANLDIESRGLEWFLTTRGTVVDGDIDGLGQPRRLWRYENRPGGTVIVGVEVVNSTPDPDGSRRSYFIRVTPDVRTSQAAVAWTFGIRARDYEPALET